MTWAYFCELWIGFNFWMGALIELMVTLLLIDFIVSDIKKFFRKKKAARRPKPVPAHTVKKAPKPIKKLPEKIK